MYAAVAYGNECNTVWNISRKKMRQRETSTGHRLPSSTRVTTDLALSIQAGEAKREMCLDMRLNHVLNQHSLPSLNRLSW